MENLTQLEFFTYSYSDFTFIPPEVHGQGIAAILAYLRDYQAMQVRHMIAAIAGGVGGMTGLILAFRYRQRRGLSQPSEKKKRL